MKLSQLTDDGRQQLLAAFATENVYRIHEVALGPELLRIPPDLNKREPCSGLSVEMCRRLIRPGEFGSSEPLVRSRELQTADGFEPITLLVAEDVVEIIRFVLGHIVSEW